MLETDDLELLSSLSENSYGALLALFANHPLGKNLEFLERVFFWDGETSGNQDG